MRVRARYRRDAFSGPSSGQTKIDRDFSLLLASRSTGELSNRLCGFFFHHQERPTERLKIVILQTLTKLL